MLVNTFVTICVADGDLSLEAPDAETLVIRIIAGRMAVSNAVMLLVRAAIGSKLEVTHDGVIVFLIPSVSLHAARGSSRIKEGKPCDVGNGQ